MAITEECMFFLYAGEASPGILLWEASPTLPEITERSLPVDDALMLKRAGMFLSVLPWRPAT